MNIAKSILAAFAVAWLIIVTTWGTQVQTANYDLGLWVKFLGVLVPVLVAGYWIVKATDK